MTAEIVPTTVERSVYGHIPGRVISVAPLPATPEGMRRVLQNGQLVQELTASGAPIEVRIALERAPANRSGFAWSASKGPRTRISAGSIIDGQVVVDRKPVIAWLVPRAGD
jgi:HlyD family secretion protein